MAKFHLLWRLNEANVPADPKERGQGWGLLMAMVKQDLKKGVLKDWGAFPSEGKGYCIAEGSAVEVMKMTEQYVPYVSFESKAVATADDVGALIKHLSG